jgi:demethylmenaquinone methyltransferase/2-methoxy-6-polyprenyl-1,4-benzoquinol methylase
MNKNVQKIYSRIPGRYELVNHILTFGLDILSRKRAVKLAIQNNGSRGARWLDVCSGTGETANYLAKKAKKADNGTSLFAVDFSLPMTYIANRKPAADEINFSIADAAHLPFADNSFDLVTISFATRNLNASRGTLIKHLREFYRILKPGGRFVNLETSQPKFGPVRSMMYLFIKLTVVPIGAGISGSRSAYAYLANTIPRFYSAEELAEILHEVGFSEVSFRRMYLGITAVHLSVK